MSANSGNKWEYSGKLENESGASLYFVVGEEPRAKFARFNVIVEENMDKSKTQIFYSAVFEAKVDHGYDASSDELIWTVTHRAARFAAQRWKSFYFRWTIFYPLFVRRLTDSDT